MKRRKLHIEALLAAAMLLGPAAAPAVAQPAQERPYRSYSTATYVTTGLSNVLYVPAKVLFAGAGAVTSGVAYVTTLGNERVTRRIWDDTTGGDYVITPGMIAGERPVHFVGRE